MIVNLFIIGISILVILSIVDDLLDQDLNSVMKPEDLKSYRKYSILLALLFTSLFTICLIRFILHMAVYNAK